MSRSLLYAAHFAIFPASWFFFFTFQQQNICSHLLCCLFHFIFFSSDSFTVRIENTRWKKKEIFLCAQQWLLLQLDLESIARQQTVCYGKKKENPVHCTSAHCTHCAHTHTHSVFNTFSRLNEIIKRV